MALKVTCGYVQVYTISREVAQRATQGEAYWSVGFLPRSASISSRLAELSVSRSDGSGSGRSALVLGAFLELTGEDGSTCDSRNRALGGDVKMWHPA